VLSKEEFRPK